MRYQITSDSTCDLSPEQLERYNIRLLPLYVNMDGKTLRDGVDVRPDDIYAHVSAGGGLPKTAAVNLADYVRMFTELSAQNDFVIHICISLDFSCCYQNACAAAQEYENVFVVDSENLSTGQGLLVVAAAKLANAHDFITRLPDGYNTMLRANGANLSQGQRQLLSIARAAVSDPPVMILDEATSSIDTRTEALVQSGMDKLMEGRTVFVIAHRLSTVKNADVIMVLDHGRIIERGNHAKLIAEKGVYYQLYTGAFELE